MAKVTLLGDSIRQIGYGKKVADILGDDYEVFQPEDNCRFAKYTLRMLFDYREQIKDSDVVHWNNGLWDVSVGLLSDDLPFSTEDEYVDNMLRIAKHLKKVAKRVIFATTTPVRKECMYNDNNVINRYNSVLVPKLKELGVEINDLHSAVSKDVYKYICDDNIHLSQDGIDLCADLVVKAIKGE
jgi:lysophospholipase L1-like esterase